MKGFFRLIPFGLVFVVASLVLATACAGLNDPSLPLAQLDNAPTPLGACLPHHYLIGGLASDGGGGSSPSQNSVTLPQCSATPTVTGTKTPTPTKAATVTSSATATNTSVGKSTATPTGTRSATSTPTLTKTTTATSTGTQKPTNTPTPTKTSTPTPTPTQPVTPTATPTKAQVCDTYGEVTYTSTGSTDPTIVEVTLSPQADVCQGESLNVIPKITGSTSDITSVDVKVSWNCDNLCPGSEDLGSFVPPSGTTQLNNGDLSHVWTWSDVPYWNYLHVDITATNAGGQTGVFHIAIDHS